MEDDAWVDEERRAAGACPACGSADVLPIVYGMPLRDDHERLGDKVVFAGCCVPVEAPRLTCRRCGNHWGRWPDQDPDELRSAFDAL